jgi:hypothetical protein
MPYKWKKVFDVSGDEITVYHVGVVTSALDFEVPVSQIPEGKAADIFDRHPIDNIKPGYLTKYVFAKANEGYEALVKIYPIGNEGQPVRVVRYRLVYSTWDFIKQNFVWGVVGVLVGGTAYFVLKK